VGLRRAVGGSCSSSGGSQSWENLVGVWRKMRVFSVAVSAAKL